MITYSMLDTMHIIIILNLDQNSYMCNNIHRIHIPYVKTDGLFSLRILTFELYTSFLYSNCEIESDKVQVSAIKNASECLKSAWCKFVSQLISTF